MLERGFVARLLQLANATDTDVGKMAAPAFWEMGLLDPAAAFGTMAVLGRFMWNRMFLEGEEGEVILRDPPVAAVLIAFGARDPARLPGLLCRAHAPGLLRLFVTDEV